MSEATAVATVTPTSASGSSERRRQPILVHVILIVGAIVMVFPFLWQLLTAFKTLDGSVQVPPQVIPDPWVFTNFGAVLETMPFARMFLNSVLLTVGRTAGQVILCTMAGYGFARIAFKGRTVVFVVFLSVLMVRPSCTCSRSTRSSSPSAGSTR
jgi:multiple sugar transport system permease protein